MARHERPAVDTGIPEGARKEMADGLNRLLADTETLYLKTHGFHWNVEGPQFQTLHLMFETQYTELWAATDLIAERIRALGVPVKATYAEFEKLASIRETDGVPEASEMVRELVKGHETAAKTARGLFGLAERCHDAVSADLLTQRLQTHEKTAWMLRSMLG